MNKIIIPIIVNFILNYLVKHKILPGNVSFVNIILTAVIIIIVGTKHLDKPEISLFNNIDGNTIDEKMAYYYPIILSVCLLTIYFIIKYAGSYKKIILKVLFFISITSSLINILPFDKTIVFLISLLWFMFDYNTQHQYDELKIYINNVIAILVALSSMKMMDITNTKTAIILLIGLFLFDVFWVFGSKKLIQNFEGDTENPATIPPTNSKSVSVMETVALNVDSPILLTYFNGQDRPMILGLGDIILPGLFIKTLVNLPLYYNTSIVSYVFGLVSAIYYSVTTGQGQPALLYIVPALIVPTVARAYFNNENIYS
jgi:minor histocompatibility antigen H13